MPTTIHEIAPAIYRLSTFVSTIGPTGFTFNQFLIDDEEPLLFHTGHRSMFTSVSDAIARIMPLDRLRWIAFGHVESDECGAMNEFLAAAPRAEILHGAVGCDVSLNEMADRPPRPIGNGETRTLGAKRVQHVDTPHVPHGWDARVLFEETTGTLFCGDLFTQFGDGPALTEGDIVGPAMDAERVFHYSSLAPHTGSTLESLAALQPRTLALMHGSAFSGDAADALRSLAIEYANFATAAT